MSKRDTPEVRQRRGTAQPTPGKCGSHLVLTDPPRYCTQRPMKGKTRCKFHGGKAKAGLDLPQTRTGLYSKYGHLSPKVFDAYQQSLADTQLLDLMPDIALLDVLTKEAAAGLMVGESVAGWEAVKDARDELRRAKSKEQVQLAMAKLDAAVDGHLSAAQAREETAKQIERRGKLVTRHRQLQMETGDLIPAKRVGVFVATMAQLAREFIPDERRAEFSRRLIGLLGPRLRPSGQPIDVSRAHGPTKPDDE